MLRKVFTVNLPKRLIRCSSSHQPKIQQLLERELHPEAIACGNEPKVIHVHGQPSKLKEKFRQFHELCEQWKLLRTQDLGNLSASRSYILRGPLAELEQALIHFTVDTVRSKNKGFQLISVPDILDPSVIEGCGMDTRGKRSQVYSVSNSCEEDSDDSEGDERMCLSGTAEMGIAAYLSNRIIPEHQLPLRFISVSRCYRAEVSTIEEEKGIFRVHNFTKVEMFGVTSDKDNQSQLLHDEFRGIQEELFAKCELHFRTLEMPANDLGQAAYRKYDIEAWMPGREQFGEISSASNCRDYQARRLNIRYQPNDSFSPPQYAHTVNGTGCAIPRMLIAVLENSQQLNGSIQLPKTLDPKYMNWTQSLAQYPKYKSVFLKSISQQKTVSPDPV